MKITLLGAGGPRPDPARHGSSLVVEIGEERLLFDCGRGAVIQLVRAGVPLKDVNPVFITHLHYDHISDLGDVILSTWLQGRPGSLKIYGPSGTAEIMSALIDRVYAKDIRFRAEGEPAVGGWKPVDVTEVGAGLVYDGGRWKIHAEHVEHGQGLGIPDFDWVTLGYRLEADGKVVTISGDAVPCEGLDRLARNVEFLARVLNAGTEFVACDNPAANHLTLHILAAGCGVRGIGAACEAPGPWGRRVQGGRRDRGFRCARRRRGHRVSALRDRDRSGSRRGEGGCGRA